MIKIMNTKKLFMDSIITKKSFSFVENKDEITGIIGYGFDNNAARMAGTSIVSVCENNKGNKFIFYLICSNIEKENIDRFGIIAKTYKININMVFLDTTFSLLKNLATDSIFPLPTWYRIFFPYILGTGRFLYLDTDVICINNISELFNMYMEGEIIGVVSDFERVRIKKTEELKLKDHIYFNAGVMLIDVNAWEKVNITDDLIRLIKKNRTLLDQDILNILFSKRPHFYLDEIYNSIGLWCEPDNIIKDRLPQIKLIHFANHPKPWNVLWQYEKRPYMENLYKDYEELSPWRGTPLEMPRIYHHKRWYAEILKNKGKLGKALYWYWQYIRGKYNF